MKWIKITGYKDLPEDNEKVIAFGTDIGSEVLEAVDPQDIDDYPINMRVSHSRRMTNGILEWIYNDHCCKERLIRVTHWMNLPEEPKE